MLAEITFGNILWAIVVVFLFTAYLMVLFSVVGDLFRDHETSGWVKAIWVFFFFIAPFLSLLIYLIARGPGMQKRAMAAAQQQQQQYNEYVKSVAGQGDPAQQIAKGKELLDAGTISQEEFDAIKTKALS